MEPNTTQPPVSESGKVPHSFKNILLGICLVFLVVSIGGIYYISSQSDISTQETSVSNEQLPQAHDLLRYDHTNYTSYEKELTTRLAQLYKTEEPTAESTDWQIFYYDNKTVLVCDPPVKVGCGLRILDIHTLQTISGTSTYYLSVVPSAISDNYMVAVGFHNYDPNQGEALFYYKRGDTSFNELPNSALPKGVTYSSETLGMGIPNYAFYVSEKYKYVAANRYKMTDEVQNPFIGGGSVDLPR
jgi:hypothetical protein